MAKQITMPMLSPSMTEGTLVKWLKKEGDVIKSGEVIAEVETDKATMDLEAFDSGTLRKILVPPGTRVSVNALIGILGDKDEAIDLAALTVSPSSQSAASVPAPAPTTPPASAPAPQPTVAAASANHVRTVSPSAKAGRLKASPLAKKVAQEIGVTLSYIQGTGPSGRILKRDVLLAKSSSGSGGWNLNPLGPIAKDERVSLSNMRQTIARRLLESKTTIPHFYLQVEVNVGPLLELRNSLNKSFETLPEPFKLSPNDFILKACAEALRKVPSVNVSFEGDAIRQHSSVHLSFAVALPNGLITPVIRDAQNKTIKTIAADVKELAKRAKEGKLKPEEYTTGTFSVSNLGMYGIESFSAIINPPQAAILAVGTTVKKPVVNERDEIVIGHRMNLTLSCDHRAVDGALGAQFLQELKNLLENPAVLLL